MKEIHENRTVILKRIDKTFGGYDFVEFNQANKMYSIGNSRAMEGHGYSLFETVVTSKKELDKIIRQLESNNYEKVPTMHARLQVFVN